MKITAREDVEVPILPVFSALTEYDFFERAALRRGAEVTRGGRPDRPEWTVAFPFRGKRRVLRLWEEGIEAPTQLLFAGVGTLFQGSLHVDLVELGKRRTRIMMTTEVKARTLGARLVLQSAALARTRINRRYQGALADLAARIEKDWAERAALQPR